MAPRTDPRLTTGRRATSAHHHGDGDAHVGVTGRHPPRGSGGHVPPDQPRPGPGDPLLGAVAAALQGSDRGPRLVAARARPRTSAGGGGVLRSVSFGNPLRGAPARAPAGAARRPRPVATRT